MSLGAKISDFVPGWRNFWFCPSVRRFLVLSWGGEISDFVPGWRDPRFLSQRLNIVDCGKKETGDVGWIPDFCAWVRRFLVSDGTTQAI
ncbi:hypothetical protein PROH_15495 [Prochlorothrix hollandica PCC 9006 = CALU 1027]|uniref:Uncharacterized protein n=1 Tax=Prochlorothrix hollandica PCC 9006 = CALU 1027 TaxID=317619 RepID=A0A0M2PRK1_PROHO|nr:hypothetical protein PROH_15495 [Prochlorothrix hollandica PCC 9006 = CALU 1027]